jgi:hypothetical protein
MNKFELKKDLSIAFSPPFDDSELTLIAMTLDRIELHFEAFENDELFETICVVGRKPKVLQFTSDHLQNVVERVLIFRRGDIVKAENSTIGLELISDKKLQKICDALHDQQVLLVVCPIAGPELITVVESVEVSRTQKATGPKMVIT